MAGAISPESSKASKISESTKGLIKEFCNYTTTHGVGRLAEAKSLFSRFIWTLFILGAFSMFLYQTHGLFELYLSRPVSTVVRVRHKTKVSFPTVTVCNQNPVKGDEIPNDYITSISKEILEELAEEGGNPTAVQGDEIDPSASSNDTDELQEDPEQQLRIDYLIEKMLISKLAVENASNLYKMGHKFNDLVFDCNFKGTDCRNYSKYWSYFWDYRYGNCYEFNSGMGDGGHNQTILKTYSTGPFGGLKLNLFIESLQYVPELTHSAGARIVVHDQNELPFPDEEGINVLPGISTSIAIRREVIERVDPFNNGSCKKAPEDDKKPYSRDACMRSCVGDAQIADCGCADVHFALDDKPVCNTVENSATENCLDDVSVKYYEGELDCYSKCPVPCSEVVFKTTTSMAEWPNDGYKDSLFNRVINRPNPAYDEELSEGPAFLNKNFLQVRVFFERLNFQEVREQLSYKEVNLLADIGGQLGLWIGVSALTCCEFLELVLLLAQNIFKRVTVKDSRVEVQS